jgi:putative effector of murein hydrolase LrgA (UPF0299 family)
MMELVTLSCYLYVSFWLHQTFGIGISSSLFGVLTLFAANVENIDDSQI